MKYVKFFIFNFFYMIVINNVSRDLGLVSSSYTVKDFQGISDPTWYESIVIVVRVLADNIDTMLQFLTLQSELPYLLNLFFVSPIYLGTLVAIILIVRGN